MTHKSGFVNILGAPNAGKSTLMNAIIGEKLSIITPKAQTTRHRIIGILNDEKFQIVFSDTPGIIEPKYELQQAMMSFVETAFEDADILLLIVDAKEPAPQPEIIERLKESGIQIIVAINKIDLENQDTVSQTLKHYQDLLPEADIIPISALHNFNINELKELIVQELPVSPPYYSKDELTDRNLRFFVSEIIREKILLNFKQEVPYSVEVVIDEFIEESEITRIRAIVFVARESQKIILIGKGGAAIKRLGIAARKGIEEFLGEKVHLELHVKVSKDWRDNPRQLKWFGYNPL